MIRLAEIRDLEDILKIYEIARKFMIDNGNPSQWSGNYPKKELLIDDIKSEHLYVYVEDNVIHGVFAFIIGEDSTYKVIEDGEWLSNDLYGTIHRIASDGLVHGVFNEVVSYCFNVINHLRIDTHYDNKVMQHLIEKSGFIKCGIIHVRDGSPRIAYEKLNSTWQK